MHSLLVEVSLLGALGLRWMGDWALQRWQGDPVSNRSWLRRWQFALVAFCLPPLLMLAMAIAILSMGLQGFMLGHAVGYWGYGEALVVLLGFGSVLGRQAIATRRACQRIRALPTSTVQNLAVRQLPSPLPFAARVGFWHSELILSSGIHRLLSPQELEAVLHHEQAHLLHRDTFWFFWLGWLRAATAWLPGTEVLWEELLLLRELRADREAARSIDPLLLAESLLKMAQAATQAEPGWVMFSELGGPSRLEQRIEHLLQPEPQVSQKLPLGTGILVLAIALPFLTCLLHRAA